MTDLRNSMVRHSVVKTDHDNDEELALWNIPDVSAPLPSDDEQKTNAMGMKPTWRYEPPEETEIVEPKPLTAEEIEEIRQAAHEEGFNEGKEQGYSQGYDEGKAQGHEDGLTAGQEEGLAQGLEQGKKQIDELAQQLSALIAQLHQPLAAVEKNVEQQLYQLVAQLTEAVVNQEVRINPDIVTAAVSEGVKALPAQEAQTQIYLHPEDIGVIEQAFSAEHIQEQGWRLLPAPQLERGSCQVENSTSNIDLRLKSRLKDVLEPFLQNAIHQ